MTILSILFLILNKLKWKFMDFIITITFDIFLIKIMLYIIYKINNNQQFLY